MRDREDNGSIALAHVGDRKRKPGEKEATNVQAFWDARPEWPRRWALSNGVERPLNLICEVETETRHLRLVPVSCRGQVGDRSGMQDHAHVLPLAPALGETRPDRVPVLDCSASLDLARAPLDLGCPCVGSVGIGGLVQAGEELVG